MVTCTYAAQHWDAAPSAAPWKAAFAFLADPIVAGGPYVYCDESDLHWTLGGVLLDAQVPLRHEVRLARGTKIDFVSGDVGVEVKTLGGPADLATRRQLLRYSRTGAVRAILLITTCRDHLRDPDYTGGYGVPVAVLHVQALRDRSCKPRFRSFR
ncbi:MAG: hypothetical protein ACRDPY_41890 [Streptosporangiaceae bacterium]